MIIYILKEIFADMLEEQKREERDPDLEVEYYIMILENIENQWKDVVEDNNE